MLTRSGKFLTIIPVALLFSLAGFGQTSNLQGDVKGEDGKPLVGVQVKIDRTDIKANYKVKTDKKGHFLYANLPTGVYTISVEVDGKEKARMADLHPRQGDNPPLDFDLSKTVQPAAAAPGLPAAPGAAGAGGADGAAGGAPKLTPEQRAEYEKKLKEQEEALAKNKALQEAFSAGMEAKNAKQWDAAVDSFKKASTLDPKQHVIWAQLGETYALRADGKTGDEKQADLGESIAAYAKAVEIKSEDPNYHNNYALILAKANKLDEAQAELNRAAQLDPLQAGKYYYNLGAVLANTGKADQAEEAFKKAIAADATYADAYYQYGLVLIARATLDKDGKMTAPAGTAEAFQKYLELKPAGPDADAAKAMLQTLGSTVQTSIGREPVNETKGKSGKQSKTGKR
jgi:tetratricopeptide (TPR) repeat protein